jgi:chromosome segregation ATPase
MAIKKRKKLILRDAGNNMYNSGEVVTMLESLTDSINLIAEQHGEIMKSIGVINKRLDRIEARLDKIEARLDKIEDRLDKVELKTDMMQKDITEIKHKLDNKIDKKEFEKVDKRVMKIEKLVLA